jgi:tetratricopeptide (TPR) repeat protein
VSDDRQNVASTGEALAMRKAGSLYVAAMLAMLLGAPTAATADQATPAQPPSTAPAPGAGEQLGEVHFPVSCNSAAQQRFGRAVAILHSFWYEEAVKAFTDVADADPGCAMAWWGVAMSHWYPLWYPPTPAALRAGAAAVAKAEAIGTKTEREGGYVAAISAFYHDSDTLDHRTRAVAYEQAMARLHHQFPDDREAAIFYALALDATALPTDKTLANQKKAAAILEPIFAAEPNHPGAAHYLIHSDDSAALAQAGLKAAICYAKIAPTVPHALHMPSHIFTRLGYWQESIDTNSRSAEAGQAYAKTEFGEGVGWDQSLHAMDYLVYAYLQLGDDRKARAVVDEIMAFKKVTPDTLAVAYAMAAIPARYALERRGWAEAAKLDLPHATLAWDKFPWTAAMITYSRALGKAHTGDLAGAQAEIDKLAASRDALLEAKNKYWSDQVEAQRRAAAAILAQAQGRHEDAVRELRDAAELEDTMEKHPVTPGSVVPLHELLGDLLLEQGQPAAALTEYKHSLADAPNRYRSLYGAAKAAEGAGDHAAAKGYFQQLVLLGSKADTPRPELTEAANYIREALKNGR